MNLVVAYLVQKHGRAALAAAEFWRQMVPALFGPWRDRAVTKRADRIWLAHDVQGWPDMADWQEKIPALVIGGGPAGLMAASQLAAGGNKVCVAEAKPSIGRKFLMAGKSGLNLTKDEPFDTFMGAFGGQSDWLDPMIRAFGSQEIKTWSRALGQDVFTGSTRRVFPTVMKASPLLRAWASQLADAGVEFRTRWTWQGWRGSNTVFDTPNGRVELVADVIVLALGGGSWARLGSDGRWVEHLEKKGISVSPFAPANFGLSVRWSDHMTKQFGVPVKNTALTCGSLSSRGEFVISAKGLEGGAVYALGPELRKNKLLVLDLFPDLSEQHIAARLSGPRGKVSLTNHLRRKLRLDGARMALFQEFGRPVPSDATALAATLKSLPINHAGPRPLDEAISTAGGVPRTELGDGLMLKSLPGVYCVGEMLDWEAPTGGYLLTACLATGRWAGLAAAERLKAQALRNAAD